MSYNNGFTIQKEKWLSSFANITASEIHLCERPTGMPKAADFAVVDRQLTELHYGEFLIRNRLSSIAPAMRPPLSYGLTSLGAAIASHALGEVVESCNDRFPVGEAVFHRGGLRDFAISNGEDATIVAVDDEPLDWHLGPLGFTDLTALRPYGLGRIIPRCRAQARRNDFRFRYGERSWWHRCANCAPDWGPGDWQRRVE